MLLIGASEWFVNVNSTVAILGSAIWAIRVNLQRQGTMISITSGIHALMGWFPEPTESYRSRYRDVWSKVRRIRKDNIICSLNDLYSDVRCVCDRSGRTPDSLCNQWQTSASTWVTMPGADSTPPEHPINQCEAWATRLNSLHTSCISWSRFWWFTLGKNRQRLSHSRYSRRENDC